MNYEEHHTKPRKIIKPRNHYKLSMQ